MSITLARSFVLALAAMTAINSPTLAQSWTNTGGNPERNGSSARIGPDSSADLIWNKGRSSIIAWQPVVEDGRVFIVRQTGFPPEPASDKSPVVCMDLETGNELWFKNIPANSGDWTTWIAGVKNGRVYASRSGNGASVQAKLYCLDAATGNILWFTTDLIDAGAYDGSGFAENGDPIISSFRKIWRFDQNTGARLWVADRLGSVSGNCGGAIHNNAIYVADAVVGGNAIKKFDLTTGAFQYQGPTVPGFTLQNSPFIGPDGTIYLSRTQNNAAVDFFYAFNDTGSAITHRWSVPCGWSTSSEFAADTSGNVYMLNASRQIEKRDSITGSLLGTTAALAAGNVAPRLAIDRAGKLFASNGAFGEGALFSFDPDMSTRWSTPITNVNIGGPALVSKGTLIIANTASVRAYRTTRCPADFNGDGFGDAIDYDLFITAFLAADPAADINEDGFTDAIDYDTFIAAFLTGC